MNWVDFLVVFVVASLLLVVIYFGFVRPAIRKKKHVPSKKAKQLVKDYHKAKEEESQGKGGSCCH